MEEDAHVLQMSIFIAMKGDAFSGKTTCANAIAKYYKCSVISFDNILDSLSTSSPPAPSAEEADRLVDLAFDATLNVAKHQLVLWRPVIIDSPLAKSSHLDKLIRLAGVMQSCGNESCKKRHCKVVVVECRPESEDTWKSRFIPRDPRATDKWYKPREWSDVVVQSTSTVEQLPRYVSRLIVDTTSQCVNERNLGPATYDAAFCLYKVGHVINFRDWLPSRPLHKNISIVWINSCFEVDNEISGEKIEKIVGGHAHDQEPLSFLPIIIAMKGDAYTGKTTCAKAIAKSYKCTLISFDDILDSISQPPLARSPQLLDLAFDVIVTIAKLQLGMGRPVVIDSPLNNPSHLRQLLCLTDELKSGGHQSCDTFHSGRFVIVECRPEAKYAWQQKFEKRDRQVTDRWYKPQEWDEVIQSESVQDYPEGKLPGYVCRLIVDTTRYVNYPYLGPATLNLCWCPMGHLFHFQDWLPTAVPFHRQINFKFLVPATSHEECDSKGRHFWGEVTADSLGGNRCCGACQKPISDPDPGAYACRICKLALHKPCAELQDKTTINIPPEELPRFLQIIGAPVSADEYYSYIPEEYRQITCDSCRLVGKDFSVNCKLCLWGTHLRSGLVPTVLSHEDHALYFRITTAVNPCEYLCNACKLPGYCVGYTCDSTFRYNVHVECALLPRPFIRHVHGGHEHDMRMVFGTEEVEEDYLCNVCNEPRDSTAWYYYCDICEHASHLHCIYA